MKKKYISLLIAVLAMGLVVSCLNPLTFTFENVAIDIDVNGHFTIDVTYVQNNYSSIISETFGKDGSYTRETENYVGTAWTVASGNKGTYSYSKDTLLMTINYAQIYDVPSTSYIAMTAAANPTEPKTLTMSAIFFQKSYGPALSGSGTTFSGDSGSQILWDGASNAMALALAIGTDLTVTSTITVKNTAGVITPETSQIVTVNAAPTITPAGAKLENGKTISYNYLSSNQKVFPWNAATNTFDTTPTVSGGTTSSHAWSLTVTLSGDGKALLFTSLATFTAWRGISVSQ